MYRLPEVRIRFSHLLYETWSQSEFKLHPDWYGQLPPPEQLKDRVPEYRAAWQEVEQIILTGLTDIFGLHFYQPVIDVYMAPCIHAMSNPLIINFRYSPDEFIDALTHELIHRLLSDNVEGIDIVLGKMLAAESRIVQNHVLVHAALKQIFLDVLRQPERLERNIKADQKMPDYARAWEIVEQKGYREILDRFRSLAHQD